MINTITLVFLDISGIILIITYFYLLSILQNDDWSYRFFKTFSSYRSLKKHIDENNLDASKKEKCCFIYKIGIYSTYIYFISIFCILVITLVTGTI